MNLHDLDAERLAHAHGIKAESMRKFYRHSRYLLTIAIAGFGAIALFIIVRHA